MALALRFAEEAEFSSRAVGASYDDVERDDERAPTSIFRWSKPARARLADCDGVLAMDRLVVAVSGAPQRFLERLTAEWTLIGTLVVSDDAPTSTTLDAHRRPAAAQLVSFEPVDHADFGKHVAVVVPAGAVSSGDAVWLWTQTLQRHVVARETIVLDAQVSPIYDFGFGADDAPMLRTLASTAARDEKFERLVPTLETPRFVTGVTAALLTQGELRHTRVRAFVSLRSANALLLEAARSFSPLVSLLDLPTTAAFRGDSTLSSRSRDFADHEDGRSDEDLNTLYT